MTTPTTENFYTPPKEVLKGCMMQQPAAVLVCTMDDHGGISVFASHSTPIAMLMAKRIIPTIMEIASAVPEEDA